MWFEVTDKANPTSNTVPKVLAFGMPSNVPGSGLFTPANNFKTTIDTW